MPNVLAELRVRLRALHHVDESLAVRSLLRQLELTEGESARICAQAQRIVALARQRRSERKPWDVFLQEFGLSTQEGIALLSLAEALLRVPDHETVDNLIAEKMRSGSWAGCIDRSESALVNAAVRAAALSSRVVDLDEPLRAGESSAFRALLQRLGAPLVRSAIRTAMRLLGGEFVLGRTIEEALLRVARSGSAASFDMLGEGARTTEDAERHFEAYLHCIRAVAAAGSNGPPSRHGVSVKLSALHPRYEYANRERVLRELLGRLKSLAHAAQAGNIQLTIDAEEAARLDLSLDVIEDLARDPDLAGWPGLGLAVQCYSKRASAVFDWLIALARETRRKFFVRLVKGAYWDAEIKRAQELGLSAYPVFTRKETTDLSYLACARKVLGHPHAFHPQFATHNAHTIAAVLAMAGRGRDFEFQRLHGMGELIYDSARQVFPDMPQVRVYAPVGAHKDLLAYLVRRLLENGANASFVNRFMNERVPLERLIEDPARRLQTMSSIANPEIPLPARLYGEARRNSSGTDLSDPCDAEGLLRSLNELRGRIWSAAPIVCGIDLRDGGRPIRNPANHADVVGTVADATPEDVQRAVESAVRAQPEWDREDADRRAAALDRAAEILEAKPDEFISLLVREAGKTLPDAIAEVREAVDFCRYYALQAREHFRGERELPGPTGERNLYSLHGRGAWVCISPWNFPLAIFIGQVTAALAAGNSVLAKPAEQTPLIAAAAVRLLHRAGIPVQVLHLLPGPGEQIGAALVADERTAGVAMTGSTATAKLIARALAARNGPIVPLIAETGGQNAMFVDSTALPEQVVDDVIRSAFHSAGQRCSALRVLYLQDDVADDIIAMLKGAMDELKIGDPAELSTDVGPVIDSQAREQLLAHAHRLIAEGRLLHSCALGEGCEKGTFVAPHLLEIDSISSLTQEHFGPLLHVVRYRARDLAEHLQAVAATGFGLTLGVHTRIDAVARHVFEASRAGNVYVNRNMIGAVVGTQPFGGYGLSGTGPKAGGPLYLQRFAVERVLTLNTAATGGNLDLLRIGTDD